ncbi:MAG TPA: NDP-sugar synthase [Solirubrobacteraceae bacterium]|nr:NDP-sugar synthase [Solirubrobacteraceae bacterium]
MQALILVGGEGTRLRPLTSRVPKPVIALAGRPFMSYMLQWLRGHGVDRVILSCGFLPDGVRAVLGDGAEWGVELTYVEEPRPLGTGGALKYAGDLLDERFFMLNGDVLTDIDLTAQLAQHQATGARATLALYPVDDPSGYGLVRRREDHSVREFVEKPSPEEIDTHLINAGAYILERAVLEEMGPAGSRSSIERDLFPRLVDRGLYGYAASGYWMDIGTPQRYLQATWDILESEVRTAVGAAISEAHGVLCHGDRPAGTIHGPAVIGPGCTIAPDASVTGRTVLGAGVRVGAGASIDGAVVLDGATIGDFTRVTRSIVGPGAWIGDHCRIEQLAMVGQDARLGSGNTLTAGVRIFPEVDLPDGAIAF